MSIAEITNTIQPLDVVTKTNEVVQTINNSSFTADQWGSTNSGVTANDVSLAQSALQSSDVVSTYSSTGTAPINGTGVAEALTFSNVTWQDGETPDMSSTGTYFLAFRTINGGSTWLGKLQGKW